MSHGQVKCQSGASEGGSLIDETTDIYFMTAMSQALNLGKRDIFVCHLYRLSYNYLFFIKFLLLNITFLPILWCFWEPEIQRYITNLIFEIYSWSTKS